MQSVVKSCFGKSSFFHEDRENYNYNWQKIDNNFSDYSTNEFSYRHSNDLNSIPFYGQVSTYFKYTVYSYKIINNYDFTL